MVNDDQQAIDIVEGVLLLWELCVPVADIARRLRIDQATTLYIIEHRTLPARQMTLAWSDEPQASPIDGEAGR